jgi:transposase
MNDELESILKLIMPDFLVAHFAIKKIEQEGSRINLYLEEKSSIPEELQSLDLIGHGFHNQSTIKDFPLRGKQVYLLVKRRRWLNRETKEIVSRDWKEVAKGTKMTNDFATFLKELD